jgi:hypothetical protein
LLSSQATEQSERPAIDQAQGQRPRARWWATAAGLALLGAIVWGTIVLFSWGGTIEDLPRTAVPGELALDVEEGQDQVIYVERETWTATTPLDVDVELEVLDPDGEPVAVESYDAPVNYRWIELVGQAHATFDATTSGTHTVTVAGQVDDDTRISVGPSLSAWPFWQLAGPAVLLIVALIAGTVAVVVWPRDRTATQPQPTRR